MKRIFTIILTLLCVLLVSGGIFWSLHPTHYAYNDRFILGNVKGQLLMTEVTSLFLPGSANAEKAPSFGCPGKPRRGGTSWGD